MTRKFVMRAWVSGTIFFSALLAVCAPALAQSLDSAKALDEQAMERYLAGNVGQARELAEQALAIREKALGPDAADVGLSLGGVAVYRMLEGRFADAESYLSRALRIMEKVYGAEHPAVGALLNKFGELYTGWGRYGEAEATLKRALAMLQNAPDEDN